MAKVKWQDLCKKIKFDNTSQKLIRQTVLAYYSAFETHTIPGCHIFIPGIGRFKGSEIGVRHLEVIERRDYMKDKHSRKLYKRRQREWARMKFDNQWI